MPPNTVKVDRSTPFGNPYEIRERSRGGLRRFSVVRGSSAFASNVTYQEAIAISIDLFRRGVAPLLDLERLRGKNLACWCKMGQRCHADVLLELANR